MISVSGGFKSKTSANRAEKSVGVSVGVKSGGETKESKVVVVNKAVERRSANSGPIETKSIGTAKTQVETKSMSISTASVKSTTIKTKSIGISGKPTDSKNIAVESNSMGVKSVSADQVKKPKKVKRVNMSGGVSNPTEIKFNTVDLKNIGIITFISKQRSL